jgi:hypothetical protein
MGLDISVFGMKQFLGPVNGQVFDSVCIITAAIIAFAGVALGILVGEN